MLWGVPGYSVDENAAFLRRLPELLSKAGESLGRLLRQGDAEDAHIAVATSLDAPFNWIGAPSNVSDLVTTGCITRIPTGGEADVECDSSLVEVEVDDSVVALEVKQPKAWTTAAP